VVHFGPEAVLFTFSKMAAGMYLEHYLDSKLFIMRLNAEPRFVLLGSRCGLRVVVQRSPRASLVRINRCNGPRGSARSICWVALNASHPNDGGCRLRLHTHTHTHRAVTCRLASF